MDTADALITEYASGALLRYFRKGAAVSVNRTRFDIGRDAEMLRHHWALSGAVRSLATHLLNHPHETQSLLAFRSRIDDAVVRGRIDARRTVLHQLQTGVATAVVSDEPVRSFDTGPNQVLAWVLNQALVFSNRILSWQGEGSAYETLAQDVLEKLSRIRRIDTLREALNNPTIQRRPSPGTLRDAARSRRLLYRHAVDAYDLLKGIENGDPSAIESVVRTTLVGPLEIWRRFELAVAMAIGEAMKDAWNKEMQVALLSSKSSEPVVLCGPFAVYWQQSTTYYTPPLLEPSEQAVRTILQAYGINAGGDRPDLVVVDREKKRIVAIVEVKFLAGDTGSVRFKEAVEQIVRYSRGYASGPEMSSLVGRSLVAMSDDAPARADHGVSGIPGAIDLTGIRQGALTGWAKQLRA